MEEYLYGGGQSVPVRADDDQPNESEVVSNMFFLAKDTVLASEFEIIASKPIIVEDGGEPEVFFLVTFKGKLATEDRLHAVTVLMSPHGIRALSSEAMKLYQQVPVEFR